MGDRHIEHVGTMNLDYGWKILYTWFCVSYTPENHRILVRLVGGAIWVDYSSHQSKPNY